MVQAVHFASPVINRPWPHRAPSVYNAMVRRLLLCYSNKVRLRVLTYLALLLAVRADFVTTAHELHEPVPTFELHANAYAWCMCQIDTWGSVCESCACRERLQHVAKVVIQQQTDQNVMFTASTKHQLNSTLLLLYYKPLGRLAYAPAVQISRFHDLADPRSTAGYSSFAQQPLGPLDCLLCVAVAAHACLWRWIPGSGSMEGAGAGGVARTPSFGWQQPNWHSRCATTGAHVC